MKLRKMRRIKANRFGSTDLATGITPELILIVLAIFVLGWAITMWGFRLWGGAELIPNLGVKEIPDGVSKIGVNLGTKDNDLVYFSGDEWRAIDLNVEKITMGSYEFKPAVLRDKIKGFYLDTKREPEVLIINVSHWRYWIASLGKDYNVFGVVSITKKGFSGPTSEAYIIDPKNNPDLMGFAKLDVSEPSRPLEQVIAWRDSILEGGKCEKFLDLDFNGNGKSYTVRKVDDYIFVDLNTPVSGRSQKWAEGCWGVENYIDKGLDLISSIKNVTFSYTGQTGYFAKRYAWNLYWFPNFPWWSGNFIELTRRSDRGEIYPGFMQLIEKGGPFDKVYAIIGHKDFKNQGVFINGVKIQDLNFVNGKKFNGLSDDERIKFAYIFLKEYNKYFLPPVLANSERKIN